MKSNAFILLMVVVTLSLLFAGIAMAQDMSSASQPTTAPAVATDSPAATRDGELRILLPLLAVGMVLLIVWIVRRAKSPGSLSLRDAPPRPNRLTPLHVFGPFAVFFLLTLPATLPSVRNYEYGELLVTLLSQVGWVAATLLTVAWTFPHGLRGLGLTLHHGRSDTARAVVTLLAVLPVVVGVLLLSGLLVEWAIHHGLMAPESNRRNVMLDRLQTVGALGKALIVISAVVLAPLAEELFFRGLLQSTLRNYLPPWGAIVVSSVLFALVHIAAIRDVLPLLPLAVVLGYAYERHGRLTGPIVIHALFNAIMLTAALTA